jgi:carbonic anhydrase
MTMAPLTKASGPPADFCDRIAGLELPEKPVCSCCEGTGLTTRWRYRETRRRIVTIPLTAGAFAALGVLAVGGAVPATASVAEPESATPKAALNALIAGNERYVGARLSACSENLQKVLSETESEQKPFAAVLSCADSRVPVELVFDQGVGRVFVTRVAGNIATPEIIASLEYGVAVLGTRAIVVLGHRNCGAVSAAMARKVAPGQISSLYAFIRPAVDRAEGDLDKAIRINAKLQAALLGQSSPVLAEAIAAKKLAITPAYYDVGSGRITLLSI